MQLYCPFLLPLWLVVGGVHLYIEGLEESRYSMRASVDLLGAKHPQTYQNNHIAKGI